MWSFLPPVVAAFLHSDLDSLAGALTKPPPAKGERTAPRRTARNPTMGRVLVCGEGQGTELLAPLLGTFMLIMWECVVRNSRRELGQSCWQCRLVDGSPVGCHLGSLASNK